MSYSNKYNILFVHIPKNAGTSVCEYIQCGHGHKNVDVLMKNKIKYPTAISCCIVRNPWDRIWSLYNYFKMKDSYWHSNTKKAPNKLTEQHIITQTQCKNFTDFVKLVTTKKIDCIHTKSQVSWIKYDGKIIVDKIIFFEDDLNTQFNNILNSQNFKLNCINSSNKPCTYKEQYTDETKKMIYNFYIEDITEFNYKF